VKVVLDTNVIVSGIFFGGPPGAILQAWQDGEFVLAMSPETFNELARVTNELASQYPEVDNDAILQNIAWTAEFVEARPFDQQVCEDADDDKFLECALAAGAKLVVSGDKLLLRVTGIAELEVIRPRDFVDRFLA
jgi:putative PIN family toxin of toxin-antitoxin system